MLKRKQSPIKEVIIIIYLDSAATTKITPEVLKAMMPYLTEQYANPSTLYSFGRKSKQAIEKAREQVAKAINAKPEQIFFTSGSTESNNWVLSNFNYILNPQSSKNNT